MPGALNEIGRAVSWRALSAIRIIRSPRRRRSRLADRPARLIADIGGRPQILVGETERAAAFTERRDLEGKFRAANAGARNRAHPHQFGVLLDGAGLQACDLGLGPPWLTLFGEKSATAARQRDKDEGADEIQTNSARHAENFNEFI